MKALFYIDGQIVNPTTTQMLDYVVEHLVQHGYHVATIASVLRTHHVERTEQEKIESMRLVLGMSRLVYDDDGHYTIEDVEPVGLVSNRK